MIIEQSERSTSSLAVSSSFNLNNPCWACIQMELQFMDIHVRPFNCIIFEQVQFYLAGSPLLTMLHHDYLLPISRAGADPGQCISQWDVLSLDILDFSVVFMNPKHHPCDAWRSCCKVFLENLL